MSPYDRTTCNYMQVCTIKLPRIFQEYGVNSLVFPLTLGSTTTKICWLTFIVKGASLSNSGGVATAKVDYRKASEGGHCKLFKDMRQIFEPTQWGNVKRLIKFCI